MTSTRAISIRATFLLLFLCWSAIMLVAMGVDIRDTNRNILAMVRIQARTAIDKDILYRKWNAMNGGVYGTISAMTRPNPYLHVPDREVTTPSGRRLTLINPAYMTRQVHELQAQDRAGLQGHITSLDPIRPENAPDAWERQALEQLATNKMPEVSALIAMDGQSYLRLMVPLRMEQACLKCHGYQGYKVGDLRGGISVSVPMREWEALKARHLWQGYLLYLGFWLTGLAGMGATLLLLRRQITRNQAISDQLHETNATLDRINDCVLMIDPDTLKVFSCNAVVPERTGYSREELLAMTPADLFDTLNQDHFRDLADMLISGDKDLFQFEAVLKRKDGSTRPVDVQLQYIEPAPGRGRIVAVLRDLSKRKALEEEQRKMEQRLLQAHKLESVGQLAAGIAHEINTPTQFVGSNIDFLDEAYTDVAALMKRLKDLLDEARKQEIDPERIEELRQAMDEIDWDYLAEEIPSAIAQSREGVARVSSIVRAMKEFSHPGGRNKAPLDLNQLIDTTVTVARNEWKYVAEVKTDFGDGLEQVPCLSDEMGQVILNLLVNAAHAIAEKLGDNPQGDKGTITITTRRIGDRAEIRIHDTGCGIPEDIQERIFDPFFTTKEVGKGTGQGLAIARDVVVNKHGGELGVESTPGESTTFIIRLPLIPAART